MVFGGVSTNLVTSMREAPESTGAVAAVGYAPGLCGPQVAGELAWLSRRAAAAAKHGTLFKVWRVLCQCSAVSAYELEVAVAPGRHRCVPDRVGRPKRPTQRILRPDYLPPDHEEVEVLPMPGHGSLADQSVLDVHANLFPQPQIVLMVVMVKVTRSTTSRPGLLRECHFCKLEDDHPDLFRNRLPGFLREVAGLHHGGAVTLVIRIGLGDLTNHLSTRWRTTCQTICRTGT